MEAFGCVSITELSSLSDRDMVLLKERAVEL